MRGPHLFLIEKPLQRFNIGLKLGLGHCFLSRLKATLVNIRPHTLQACNYGADRDHNTSHYCDVSHLGHP